MIRGINVRGAVAINIITMIGIGPLITIPLVLAQLAGPLALIGWAAGALVALCDGLVWAELGSRYPVSGGTYVYLREIFGRDSWGRPLAFLFNWQFFLSASLTVSTGYIGFANYAGYLFPRIAASVPINHAVALGIGLLTIALLYRRITAVAWLGGVLAAIAVLTLLLVGAAGFSHADFHRAFHLTEPVKFGWGFVAGLGSALYITLYDYGGYSEIALVGEEVRNPKRTLPLAILGSIAIVFLLYFFLQIGVLAAIPWQTLVGSGGGAPPPDAQFVASTVVANAWGHPAAFAITALILITAFASVYGNLLGASRVPFAAARDGAFLPVFARLHPAKHFPHVSLLAMGALSLAGCFFDLTVVIAVVGTAGILIGAIGQILALFVLRARGERPPFRMWLFPLPALVALAGWIYAFANTGANAMAFGVGWLGAGIIVYLFTARAQRHWPFAAAAAAGLLCALIPSSAQAAARQPFVYGAAFFYERIPRSQWQPALLEYRRLHVNTIDLYVMWNWHELRDGEFDFTGRTNPRRDLTGLLKLIHSDGFKLVLRPGPVIRNEWRNGGYPAWLLQRSEYHMPKRDILEGRYPATATLQNAHSDAAAAEWMNNATHMRYATRWLARVLQATAPWRSDIVAIALDDDQGAYIDNDTWPGPHFHRYIHYLAWVVHKYAGASIPVFINTYQMKVTASAPEWAWGNWYQSDAYSIGEHDRAQLEFSTGLLQTQPGRAVMVSEFQAGWLQNADQAAPRSADPSNTTLALHTMLQMGAHGVINFPVQDTLDPAGWEAPWANAFYSWDSALSVELTPQARYVPTQRFGDLIAAFGPLLAATHPAADAAIAYLTSAYDERRITNEQIAQIAQATINAQRGCRIMRITCALVDLRYEPPKRLKAYRALIVPPNGTDLPFTSAALRSLAAYRSSGGRIIASARKARIARPAAGGIPNAVVLTGKNGAYAFLDIVNYSRLPLRTEAAQIHGGGFSATVPALTVAPRDALLLPFGAQAVAASHSLRNAARAEYRLHAAQWLPLRPGSRIVARALRPVVPGGSVTYRADVFQDGYPALVLENARMRLILAPCAGGRAFIFEDKTAAENLFTTIGGLRDAATPQPPPSARDYIGKYTHPIAAGTFNRCYAARIRQDGSVELAYKPFKKTLRLDGPAAASFTERTIFAGAGATRAQQLTSFALSRGASVFSRANGYAFYDSAAEQAVFVSWRQSDVVAHTLDIHRSDALLTLTYAAGRTGITRFGFARAQSGGQAQAELRAFANRAFSW